MANYYLTGYYLVQLNKTAERPSESGFIYSANDCVNFNLLGLCGFSWSNTTWHQEQELLSRFHLSKEKLDDVRQWSDAAFENKTIGWSNVFNTADAAKEYYKLFFTHLDNIVLLDVSFSEKETHEFLNIFKPQENVSGMGMEINLSKAINVPDYGISSFRGYDIVGVELGGDMLSPFCCNNITLFIHKTNSPINKYGLWASSDAFYEILDELILQKNNPEAVPWFVCRVNEVTLI